MGNEHTEYDGEVDVPPEAIQIIDPQVVQKLPNGTKATAIAAHGTSFWTRTACLHTELDGQATKYFLKTSYGDRGRQLMFGEFNSMTNIYAVSPRLVPRPIAWGSYETLEDVHFFLSMIADLHRNGTSPNGKFGFYVTTFHGNTPIDHGWSDTWEEYFTRTTRTLIAAEQEAQGPNQEILDLAEAFFDKVVPRLLRPMETGGRFVKPALIHGDLWHGNAAMDGDTDEPVIFDAASFYAHNEYELAVWRQPWNRIKTPYRTGYRKNFPSSHPEEDFDDRGDLYATRVNILDSILYKGDDSYREMLITSLKGLVAKFGDGYEGWAKNHIGLID